MAGPILRLKDMIAHTGLSRSVIYERMNEKSTRYAKDFPKSFSLDGGAIGWFQSEVDAWLESCAATGKRGTKSKKIKSAPDHQKLEDVSANPSALPAASIPPGRFPQKQPRPNRNVSPSPAKRSARPRNLADAIVEGGRINDRILHHLQLKEWTPAMGAMLISGIDPLTDGNDIPYGGVGLDGVELHGSNHRFNSARRILKDWRDWEEDRREQHPQIAPLHFFEWCIEEGIATEWLSLLQELAGYTEASKVDLTPARLAMLTNR